VFRASALQVFEGPWYFSVTNKLKRLLHERLAGSYIIYNIQLDLSNSTIVKSHVYDVIADQSISFIEIHEKHWTVMLSYIYLWGYPRRIRNILYKYIVWNGTQSEPWSKRIVSTCIIGNNSELHKLKLRLNVLLFFILGCFRF